MIDFITTCAATFLVFSPCLVLAKIAIECVICQQKRAERHKRASQRHELYEMRKTAQYLFDNKEGLA